METLETLAVALGFATLAGLNLYLVVFVAGLAISQGWVDVSVSYPELMVLGEPAVLVAAGILFALEFFSDKVPWVDSLWDGVHTLVRPVGGALLALQTLGPTEPAFGVIVALLAGGTTLVAHSFKAGTRLAINASPEPVSNVAASVTEDVAVLGGLLLMSVNPILAAVFFLLFLGAALYLTPKLMRRMKGFFWLVGHRVLALASRDDGEPPLYEGLSADEDRAFARAQGGRECRAAWSVPVLVGRTKRFPGIVSSTFGRVFAEESGEAEAHFVGRRLWGHYHVAIPLEGLELAQESRLFSEDVVLYDREGSRRLTLKLPHGRRALSNRLAESLLQSRDRSLPMPQSRILLAEEEAAREVEAETVSA